MRRRPNDARKGGVRSQLVIPHSSLKKTIKIMVTIIIYLKDLLFILCYYIFFFFYNFANIPSLQMRYK